MSCEKAAIYSEGRVAAEEDDVSVFEPEVGITLDGVWGEACCDGGHLAGLGGSRVVCDVDSPSFHDAIGGHQVPAGTDHRKERHESLLSLAISFLWEGRRGRTGSWPYL